jgi:biotin-dependent carboxylase-like uncharacterized protein
VAALLEVTLGGAELRMDADATVAVTGGLSASIAARPVPAGVGVRLRASSTLRIGPSDGARGYVAIAGGIVVDVVLGSASTDLRSGFGGHEGRALRAGDRLATGATIGEPGQWTGARAVGPIRIVQGPQPSGLEALVASEWEVGIEADRAGVRLDGRRVPGGGEVPSMGLPLGAVQVPPDGRPIVMLADRPVTGGYPVPACVVRADVGRVAQLLPGDRIRFTVVSADEARAAWAAAARELELIEPVAAVATDALGWAGSHD